MSKSGVWPYWHHSHKSGECSLTGLGSFLTALPALQDEAVPLCGDFLDTPRDQCSSGSALPPKTLILVMYSLWM